MNFPKYLINDFESGVLINLKRGSYTSVQSRSKVNISKDDLKILKSKLLVAYHNCVSIFIANHENRNPISNNYYSYLYSPADPRQLQFGGPHPKNLSNSASFYMTLPSYNGKNIAYLTDLRIKHGKGFIEKFDIPKITMDAIDKWFSNKNEKLKTDEQFRRSTIEEINEDPIIIKSKEFLQEFTDIFWSILLELNIPEIKPKSDPPKIFFNKSSRFRGAYTKSSHDISISLKFFHPDTFISELQQLKKDYKKLKDLSPLLRLHGGPKVLGNNKKLKK